MWYIGLSEYLRTHYWPDENAFEFDARLSQLFVEVTVHAEGMDITTAVGLRHIRDIRGLRGHEARIFIGYVGYLEDSVHERLCLRKDAAEVLELCRALVEQSFADNITVDEHATIRLTRNREREPVDFEVGSIISVEDIHDRRTFFGGGKANRIPALITYLWGCEFGNQSLMRCIVYEPFDEVMRQIRAQQAANRTST